MPEMHGTAGLFEAAYNDLTDNSDSHESAESENPDPVTESAGGDDDLASDQAQPEVGQTQETEPLQPPPDWSNGIEAEWAQAPRKLQEAILEQYKRTQADYTKKTQDVAELRRNAEAIEQAAAPHSHYLSQKGLALPQVVNDAVTFRRTLDTNPIGAIQNLMRLTGVTPQHLAQTQQSSGQFDPAIQQLSFQVNQLQSHFQSQAESQAQAQANSVIVEFANTKDASGALKYPHFEDVKPYLSGLIADIGSVEPDLSDVELLDRAYAEAILPIKALEKKLSAERQEKVKAAKIAGSSVSSSPGSGSNARKAPKNGAEALRQTYEELSSRR